VDVTTRSSDLMVTAPQPARDWKIQFYIPFRSNADLSSGKPWPSGGAAPFFTEAGYDVQQ